MKLPTGNTITLAPTNEEVVIDSSDPHVPTLDDVIALLPGWAKALEGPVRDAVLGAFAAIANRAWARAGQAIGRLQTPRNADGPWLDEWGALMKRPRAYEGDPAYRARLLSHPAEITPDAIRNAVTAIVSAVLATPAIVIEPTIDCMFVCSGDPAAAAWTSWVQPPGVRLWADYPDNPYPFVGAYVAPTYELPEFWVVMVTDGTATDDAAFVATVADLSPTFVGRSTDASPPFVALAQSGVGEQVISDVNARRAFGIRWWLWVDPGLARAK